MKVAIKAIPVWILIVSGIIALMEVMVSALLCFSPESTLETVDLKAKGVEYVIQMWSARQFALGVIFALAVVRRSAPMLTIAYVFLLVMFIGDCVVGFLHQENMLVMTALLMAVLSGVMIFMVNRKG